MRKMLIVLAAAAMLFAAAGCKSGPAGDPKAKEACKTSAKDADGCKSCCQSAGSHGHMFMTGSGCTCL